MKKILTVSLFAMMAVSAANADIASTEYVGKQITATAGTLGNLDTTEKTNLVGAINEVNANISSISTDTGKLTSGLQQLQLDLEDAVEAYEAADTALDGRVDALEGDNTTNKNNITNLQTAVNELNTGDNSVSNKIAKALEDYSTTTEMNTAITNNAVNTVVSGTANGTIEVDGTDVAVKGLGSAAYTEATAYATSAQGQLADSAVQTVATGSANGTIAVDGTDVAVKGLGSAAYTASTAYATAAQGTLAASAVQPDELAAAKTELEGKIAEASTSAGTALTDALKNYSTTTEMNTAITNNAVNKVVTGTANGTIEVDGTDVAVKGLGSAAYTQSSAYATAAQGELAASAMQEANLKALDSYTENNCGTEGVMCSLVSDGGKISWEVVNQGK